MSSDLLSRVAGLVGHATDPTPRPVSTGSTGPNPEIFRRVPSRRRDRGARTYPATAAPWLPERLFDRPTSLLVCGPSRSLVNLTLYAFAEATTPAFQWVDIQVPGEERLPWDPVRLGWIPDDRRWSIDHPSALRPDDLAANLALFALIRSDEPSPTLLQISEFLRLPEISQRILAARPLPGRPGVVAVPNAQRVVATFTAGEVPAILSVHRSAGYSVYVGYADAPGAGKVLFDYVFELDGESVSGWRESHVTCVKGILSGPLADGRPAALADIPLVAAVVSRATGLG
jgi:hypothetical protein